MGQFWLSIQAPNRGNMAGEHDGGNKPDDSAPFAIPQIANVTYIGSGANSGNTKSMGLIFRDNAGGKYMNGIITEVTEKGLEIEDLENGQDSESRLATGDLHLQNMIWWNIAGKEMPTINEIAPDVPDTESGGKVIKGYSLQTARTYLGNTGNGNKIVNPNIASISRRQDSWGLDPRPAQGAAWSGVKQLPSNGFHTQTDYIGAFGNDNWAVDWTALNTFNVMNTSGAMNPNKEVTTSVNWNNNIETSFNKVSSINLYPNPVEKQTTIEFELTQSTMVTMDVYDATGSKLEGLVSKQMTQGNWGITWTPNNLVSGAYFIQMTTDYGTFTQKVIVK